MRAALLFLALASQPDYQVPGVIQSYEPMVNRYADAYMIPRHVARKLMVAESGGNPLARSKEWKKVGSAWKPGKVLARGLFQISVEYQAVHAKAAGVRNFDWRNPEHSTRVGLHLFRDLMDSFGGDLYLSVASYNCGPWGLRYYDEVPIETLKHLTKVFG